MLMGRLTKDPEVRYFQTNAGDSFATARYTLAVNRDFKREGEPEADFINCSTTGKRAEFAERYLKKGQLIAVCGRLQVRSWDDQNGQRQWATDVQVEEHHFAESKAAFESHQKSSQGGSFGPSDSSSAPSPTFQQQNPKANEPSGFLSMDEGLDDEDLPF